MLCLSIDLDPLDCYRALYGLPAQPGRGPDPVVTTAVERFAAFAAELGAPGTLFCVGRTLADPAARAALGAALEAGHELANHTWSHPYGFSRLPDPALRDEIVRGARAVEELAGRPPAGFRAPGYLLGRRVLGAVRAAGHTYDASALPSPVYQAAKAAAVGLLRLAGRPSAAVLGDPREALGPRGPYRARLERPFRAAAPGEQGLWELPVSAFLGLPLTGGLLALLGPAAAGLLGRALAGRAWVQLELHGLDLLDLAADGLEPALAVQREVRIPWERKADTFRAFLGPVLARHEAVTLEEAARRLG